MSEKQLSATHGFILVVLTVFAYQAVRTHYFVWDTIPFVVENPWVHEWSLANLIAMFTEAHRANWHPMVLLSHSLDFYLFGDDAGLHHLTNLALHCLNVLLLYTLIIRILTRTGLTRMDSLWAAFLTALIFGLHPQHVESVAWVVERKDVLYTAFAFTSLHFYMHYHGRINPGGVQSGRGHLWSFTFFCLAVATKPMAVTLPVVMLMLDRFPLNRWTGPGEFLKLVWEKWHYLLVSFAIVLITLTTQSEAMPDAVSLPLWARALNAIDNTWFYVAHYVWPVNLSPFYPYPQNAGYLASPAFWLPGTLFLVVSITVAAWLWLRGQSWPMLLLGFYLVTLLPVSGLIHVGPAKATDHYVYMATIPFSLLTAMLIALCWRHQGLARLLSAALGASYLVFLLLITQQQVSYWNNPLSLWSRVTQLHPNSPYGHRNLAAAYVQTGDWHLALEHAERSLQLGSPDTDYVERLRQHVEQQFQAAEPELDAPVDTGLKKE